MIRSLVQLGLHSALWSLLAIGGNMVVLPAMHHYTVDIEHWLTNNQFIAFFALSQAAPGPNGMALVLIGQQAAGFPGAITALVSQVAPSSLLAYHGGAWFDRQEKVPWVQAVRQGLAPVTVGLVLAASFVLARTTDITWSRAVLTAMSAAVVFRSKINPLWLIGIGTALGLLSGLGGMHIF